MKEFGFVNICAVTLPTKVGDVDYNISHIISWIENVAGLDGSPYSENDIIVFPELCATGYTCGDLFLQSALIRKAEEGIAQIIEATKEADLLFAVGAPLYYEGSLYNCAFIIAKGRLCGIVPKIHIPNYGEFYEKRWFTSGRNLNAKIKYGKDTVLLTPYQIFQFHGANIGVEICEDLWVPCPPSERLVLKGADIILNLSASNELVGKYDYICDLVKLQSSRCRCGYAYSSAGVGESTSDVVFRGIALVAANGKLNKFDSRDKNLAEYYNQSMEVDIEKLRLDRLKYNSFFNDSEIIDKNYVYINCNGNNSEDETTYPFTSHYKEGIKNISLSPDPRPFIPEKTDALSKRCEEIINIQVIGLASRLRSINCKKVVIGISGGLDSALALMVTCAAFDYLKLNDAHHPELNDISHKDIIGVTMPGLATTSTTKSNAVKLMEALGVTVMEIPINAAVQQHFKDIGQDPEKYDVTYENSQARERTQILMDIANKENAIVIGTGDMSELALGWCTYNGDQMSMYGVNCGVPKTLVKHLVKWFAKTEPKNIGKILKAIIDTPITPELVPAGKDEIGQKTEDLVGPYELHDFFLYNFVRNSFSPKKIFWLAVKAFDGKYKNETILKWLKVFFRRFFSQQFKRNPMPDGPKVGTVSLSPRGDWRMPSDASVKVWMDEIDKIDPNDEIFK